MPDGEQSSKALKHEAIAVPLSIAHTCMYECMFVYVYTSLA